MRLLRRLSVLGAAVAAASVLGPVAPASAATDTVTIITPGNGAVVSGASVAVTATATVSPGDTASFGSLLVDGRDAGVADCPATVSASCTLTFAWDTSFVSGAHTLQVQFESYDATATSAPVAVTVHVPTKSRIERGLALPYGHTDKLTGDVASTSGLPLPGIGVQVTIIPATGKRIVRTVTTDDLGEWTLAYKAKVNTTVVAAVAESPAFGASHASTKVLVYATGKCTTKVEARGGKDTMTCTKVVPSLAKKTKAEVQVYSKKKWHTIATAKVSGTKFSVPFRLSGKGDHEVRLYLPATKTLTDSATQSFFVYVS